MLWKRGQIKKRTGKGVITVCVFFDERKNTKFDFLSLGFTSSNVIYIESLRIYSKVKKNVGNRIFLSNSSL